MRKRKPKKIDMSFLMVFVVLFVFIIILIAILNMINGGKDVNYKGNLSTNIQVDSGKDADIAINKQDSERERLESMTERARIEYYATKFLNYVEQANYSEAYNLLNDTYKQNYFPNLSSFEKYAKENFSKMMNIDYTNFERSGEVYVIWMTITDAVNGGPDSGKEINFVVKENDYNDFELSFSAN
jgi:competence protein ComGC